MFGSMKKAMAVAAVAAVGAMAPAVASAEQWSVGGAPYAGPAQLSGTLTMTTGTLTTTCTVVEKVDLDNGAAGGVAQGQLQEYLLGAPAGGSCSTNVPNCTLSFISLPTPLAWPISTSGRNVTLSGIAHGITFGGVGCALNGATIGVYGSTTGSMASGSNVVGFSSSPGLTTTLAPATVSGTLSAYVEKPSGGPDLTKPITLQP